MDWEKLWQEILTWSTNQGIKLILALLLLLVSFKIINLLAKKILVRCENKKVDKTLSRTLVYAFKLVLKIIIVICLVGYVGIDTSGITALITSLGVCIGLAVNGALSNLAGGIMLIITRPFRIDDYIEACGKEGTVEEIRITQTKLRTPDNKVVYLPNGTLSSNEIVNYSEKDTRRVDLVFSIGYSNDFEKAKTIVLEICNNHKFVLKDPQPFVRVKAHGESSIDIICRTWVKSENYWDVNFDLLEQVKKSFDQNQIEIPFNQLDVHVKKD